MFDLRNTRLSTTFRYKIQNVKQKYLNHHSRVNHRWTLPYQKHNNTFLKTSAKRPAPTSTGNRVSRGDFHSLNDSVTETRPSFRARWNGDRSKRVYNLIMDRRVYAGGPFQWILFSVGPWMRVTFIRNNARWQGTGGHCHACLTDVNRPWLVHRSCELSNRTIDWNHENPRVKTYPHPT